VEEVARTQVWASISSRASHTAWNEESASENCRTTSRSALHARPLRSARMRVWSAGSHHGVITCHHVVSNNASRNHAHAHAHQTTRAGDGPGGRVRERSERYRETQSGRLRGMSGSNPGEIGRIRESSGINQGEMWETGVTWRQRPNAARTGPGTLPGTRARLLGTPAETPPVQGLGFNPVLSFLGFRV